MNKPSRHTAPTTAQKAKREAPTRLFAALLLTAATLLIFTRLGHYALWDDEAIVALSARAVWHTGDTSAIQGSNIVAYAGGILLHNLHDRSTPPLPAYLAAPFVGLAGDSALAARLPFAIMGLLVVALMSRWLARHGASGFAWFLSAMAILGNVSFILFARNCRYYAPAMLFSTAIVYLYLHLPPAGGRRRLLAMAALAAALIATQYLNAIALAAVLALDYALWGRHQRRFTPRDWLTLLAPPLLIGAGVLSIWNTMRTGNRALFFENNPMEKLRLFAWMWRDLNAAEFGPLLLLAAAPLLYRLNRDPWLRRAPLALATYLLIMALLAPTVVQGRVDSDLRYLVPTIPLCIFIAVRALLAIRHRWGLAPATILALLAFGTNILHGGPLQRLGDSTPARAMRLLTWTPRSAPPGIRCTLAAYLGELARPQQDPYRTAARWLRTHAAPGQTAWVQPFQAAPPLLFHAPHITYAWQLPFPPEPGYEALPIIHFQGRQLPDFFLIFGRQPLERLSQIQQQLDQHQMAYTLTATLDCYWQDGWRPELIWHAFTPMRHFDRASDAIYVFSRPAPPAPAPGSAPPARPPD